MSKLYQKYEDLKNKDDDIIYLFLCGNFYIALDSDAILLNELFGMKLTKFSNLCDKCGFPKNSLDKYIKLFDSNNIKYSLIENSLSDSDKLNKINNIISDTNLDVLSSIELKDIVLNIKNIIME